MYGRVQLEGSRLFLTNERWKEQRKAARDEDFKTAFLTLTKEKRGSDRGSGLEGVSKKDVVQSCWEGAHRSLSRQISMTQLSGGRQAV